jgi:hypothetical protein
MDFDLLPSGARFAFWDDATDYRHVYHVAQDHSAASDEGPGTAEAPFRTINAAARVLLPGEKVVVHAGVYRECVRPARGGDGPAAMIAYEAAPGETVEVAASEVWTPATRSSAGYGIPAPANGATIWMADLPPVFGDGYNPFLLRNAYEYLPIYGEVKDAGFLMRALQRRGALYVDGTPLAQVYYGRELAERDGAFWVEEPGTRLHVRLPDDVDPAGHMLEFTAREQCFAPADFGLGYIRVSGFTFRHAADGLPVPQRAAVSTMRGHHWIIEGNTIAWVNAVGLDIGAQTWEATIPSPTGGHLVRGNVIRRCGICGIAGALGVHHTLIEGNLIEEIGGLNLERMWECGAIKLHLAHDSLIRGNTFRHLHHAGGVWLDCANMNNRLTQNTFADIASLCGGIYMEMTYDRNLIDHNVFWDIRDPDGGGAIGWGGGAGVRADCNEELWVAHNVFGKIQGHAVMFSLNQADRRSEGRTGLCRANAAVNNVFYQTPHRIHLGRREENICDGNLYDAGNDNCSFEIAHPAPACLQHLAGWQRYFGLDAHSVQAKITAEFDEETGTLTWSADAPQPSPQPVPGLPEPVLSGGYGAV